MKRVLAGNSQDNSQYTQELQRLGETYRLAMEADVTPFMNAIAGASQSSIIGVGSGGSFTVASLLCNLHETFTGRVSRASTPLEIICNPTLASTSPAFFISAEGKNPDIVEALLRARHHSARAIHVLTNRAASPLGEALAELTDVDQHVYNLVEKDGYLATNSLLMDSTVVARAYGKLNGSSETLPQTIEELRLDADSAMEWIEQARDFAKEAVSRRGIIVLYAPSLRPIATDLESKLAESALLYAQIADLRSFAHGRHLWLAARPADCAVLALTDPSLRELWSHTRTLIPSDVPCIELTVADSSPKHLIGALIAELHFVGLIAGFSARDPGRPIVPEFGRNLYYADLSKLVKRPDKPEDGGINEKFEIIGARWPYAVARGAMQRGRNSYCEALEKQVFRAVVFDYDGTLCTSQKRGMPPSDVISKQLCRLTKGGIKLAIVSGRGVSMREELRKAIPESEWRHIQLGLYNGGFLTDMASNALAPDKTSEFLNHVSRIVRGLKDLGVPIEHLKSTPPFQVSIRFLDGVDTEAMWFVIADALRQAGLDLGGIVRSRHSIDVLEPTVSKTHLVARLIQEHRLLPHELLTVGDQGAWPGNDSALLEHRFSLSVDFSSRRLDRGWKLAPAHKRGVDAGQWYLEKIVLVRDGRFKITIRDPCNYDEVTASDE